MAEAEFKVAVVTPYWRTPMEWLRQCHESVRAQTYPCTHFLVADGEPLAEVDSWPAEHIRLSTCHADNGDTPRAIGSLDAIGQGYDAIAYLDSDNWFLPDHVESLIRLHRDTGAAVCFSHRYYCRLDGSVMGYCKDSDGETFADTSAMLFTRKAFFLTSMWAMIHPRLHPICDRVMMMWIRQHKVSRAFSNRMTLCFRTGYVGDYRSFGEDPPPGAGKTADKLLAALQYLRGLGGPDLKLP